MAANLKREIDATLPHVFESVAEKMESTSVVPSLGGGAWSQSALEFYKPLRSP